MAEKMKKGPSEAGRKTLKCPHKQGINLNMREQKGNPRLTLLVGCLAIVILAGCVAKFGVIDQYRRLDAAQAAYASVHTEYTQMQELLKGYDRLLMEYRTYSMEWATDGSEDNGHSGGPPEGAGSAGAGDAVPWTAGIAAGIRQQDDSGHVRHESGSDLPDV